MENNYFLVKETGDILEYIGETLVDPHKGEYDPYYQVVVGQKFKKGDDVVQFELHDDKYNHYTLVKLPTNIDISNLEAIKVLYGR